MIKHNTLRRSSLLLKKTDGYIVIIVLLLTAVLLMLGLSLATRTTEEVYQSGQEADTTRVFNAAETGIEGALFGIQAGTVTIPNTDAAASDITATVFPSGEVETLNTLTQADLTVTGERVDDFTVEVAQGEVLTLEWKDGTKINWTHDVSGPTFCEGAAAIIVTLYNDVAVPTASHLAFDPNNYGTGCDKGSNFTNAEKYRVGGTDVGSSVSLTYDLFGFPNEAAIDSDSLLRIRPLYANASFTVENSSAIEIVSTAADTTGGGTSAETRKIQVIRTEPAAPSVFDYAVFSGGALTK